MSGDRGQIITIIMVKLSMLHKGGICCCAQWMHITVKGVGAECGVKSVVKKKDMVYMVL